MALTAHDPVCHPPHYTVYPVEPISISRHLGFCLGNILKYVLRAPWKNGVEDCDKALQYLRLEQETPQKYLDVVTYDTVENLGIALREYLYMTEGDDLWIDISQVQGQILDYMLTYLQFGRPDSLRDIEGQVLELRRILALRDTTGQIYEGMTGRPYTQEAE